MHEDQGTPTVHPPPPHTHTPHPTLLGSAWEEGVTCAIDLSAQGTVQVGATRSKVLTCPRAAPPLPPSGLRCRTVFHRPCQPPSRSCVAWQQPPRTLPPCSAPSWRSQASSPRHAARRRPRLCWASVSGHRACVRSRWVGRLAGWLWEAGSGFSACASLCSLAVTRLCADGGRCISRSAASSLPATAPGSASKAGHACCMHASNASSHALMGRALPRWTVA